MCLGWGKAQPNPFLPCTGDGLVTPAIMQRARDVLGNPLFLPDTFQLLNVQPESIVNSVHPHRWIASYDRVGGIDATCDFKKLVKKKFQAKCPAGCQVGKVGVSHDGQQHCYLVEFVLNCECPKQRRRRSLRSSLPADCKNWIFHPDRKGDQSDHLPCPVGASNSQFDEARRIIQGHSPPGYTLQSVISIQTLQRNPTRWQAAFNRSDGVYDFKNCTFS